MKKICKHCNLEIEYDKHQQFGGHVTNCKSNPARLETIRKISESRTIDRLNYKLECCFCHNEYEVELTKSEYQSRRYNKCCSKICANKKSLIFIDYNKLKKSHCIKCNKEIEIKLNSSHNCSCDECGNYKNKDNSRYKKTKEGLLKSKVIIDNKIICKICGQQTCEKTCKTWRSGRSKVFIKLGFNENKLGSYSFIYEYNRIVELLRSEYVNSSMVEIGDKYDINYQTIYTLMKSLSIKSRNNSESGTLAFKKGRFDIKNVNIYPYKSGYHNSWEGKEFWYRSSYELEYCKVLDDNKIRYEVESIRIQYFDSIKNCERTSVPDFYLIDTNEIVEIKSSWTYDEQNMKDKVLSYKNSGYKVKLILDHKEIIL